MHTDVYGTNTIRESTAILKVDSGRKIGHHTQESKQHQYCATARKKFGLIRYQTSYLAPEHFPFLKMFLKCIVHGCNHSVTPCASSYIFSKLNKVWIISNEADCQCFEIKKKKRSKYADGSVLFYSVFLLNVLRC